MMRTLPMLCCLMLCGALAAEASRRGEARAPSSAQAIAAELLREAASQGSGDKEFLQRLADGLASGTLTLEEVDRLLAIAGRLGSIAPGTAAAVDGSTATRARTMLDQLDGMPEEVRNGARGQSSQPAGGNGAATAQAPAAAPSALARVSAVRPPDREHPQTLVMLEAGTAGGLSKDQVLRIQRDGQPLVEVKVLKVEGDSAMAAVLEATWREGVEKAVRQGDQAVAAPRE